MPSRVGKNVFFLRRGRAKLTGGALAEGGRCESIPTRPAGRGQWAFIAFDVSRRHFLHVGIHLFFFFLLCLLINQPLSFTLHQGRYHACFKGKKKSEPPVTVPTAGPRPALTPGRRCRGRGVRARGALGVFAPSGLVQATRHTGMITKLESSDVCLSFSSAVNRGEPQTPHGSTSHL